MRVSLEGCVALAGLGVAGAAVATVAGFEVPVRLGAGLGAALAFGLPVASALRTWLLDVHLDRGDTRRALAAARRAHAAARRRKSRARTAVDLAAVHLAAGEAASAVPHLEGARDHLAGDDRAVATALLAIALAHGEGPAGGAALRDDLGASRDPALREAGAGREGVRALALAREAVEADPDDPLAAYALGLAHLAAGDPESALPHLLRGADDEDADLFPSPGERTFFLAEALAALGRDDDAAEARARAARVRPSGPFTRLAAAGPLAGSASGPPPPVGSGTKAPGRGLPP